MLAVTGFALLSGCTLTPSQKSETAFQVLNAVDMAQTLNIARRTDCYREVGFPAAEVIGSTPSPAAVTAYWAGSAVLHYEVSQFIDRKAAESESRSWRIARALWHTVSIGYAARNVTHNHQIGLRPFGTGISERCEARGMRP